MTGAPINDAERAEMDALLPWFATGKISASDRRRVEAYLTAHPEVRDALDLARDEARAVIAANEAVAGPSPAALDRLMAAARASPPRRVSETRGALARVADWLAGLSTHQLGFAAAAATLAIVVQAGVIGALLMTRPAVYESASGPAASSKDAPELLIGFAPEATIAEISDVLRENGATLIDGPRAGLYRVRIAASDAPAAGLDTTIVKLKASRIVTVVLPGR